HLQLNQFFHSCLPKHGLQLLDLAAQISLHSELRLEAALPLRAFSLEDDSAYESLLYPIPLLFCMAHSLLLEKSMSTDLAKMYPSIVRPLYLFPSQADEPVSSEQYAKSMDYPMDAPLPHRFLQLPVRPIHWLPIHIPSP